MNGIPVSLSSVQRRKPTKTIAQLFAKFKCSSKIPSVPLAQTFGLSNLPGKPGPVVGVYLENDMRNEPLSLVVVTPRVVERFSLDGKLIQHISLPEPITCFLYGKIGGIGRVLLCGTQGGKVFILRASTFENMLELNSRTIEEDCADVPDMTPYGSLTFTRENVFNLTHNNANSLQINNMPNRQNFLVPVDSGKASNRNDKDNESNISSNFSNDSKEPNNSNTNDCVISSKKNCHHNSSSKDNIASNNDHTAQDNEVHVLQDSHSHYQQSDDTSNLLSMASCMVSSSCASPLPSCVTYSGESNKCDESEFTNSNNNECNNKIILSKVSDASSDDIDSNRNLNSVSISAISVKPTFAEFVQLVIAANCRGSIFVWEVPSTKLLKTFIYNDMNPMCYVSNMENMFPFENKDSIGNYCEFNNNLPMIRSNEYSTKNNSSKSVSEQGHKSNFIGTHGITNSTDFCKVDCKSSKYNGKYSEKCYVGCLLTLNNLDKLWIGYGNGIIKVYDLLFFNQIHSAGPSKLPVCILQYSKFLDVVIALSGNKLISIWDAKSFDCLKKISAVALTCGMPMCYLHLLEAPDSWESKSTILLTGCIDGSICVRRIERNPIKNEIVCVLIRNYVRQVEPQVPITAISIDVSLNAAFVGDASGVVFTLPYIFQLLDTSLVGIPINITSEINSG